MDDLVELAGFGCVLAFLWFCWPPLVLLGAGVLLIAYANTRLSGGRIGAAVAAAVAAARRAYTADKTGEGDEEAAAQLRPVA